jgi:hypothetical protein
MDKQGVKTGLRGGTEAGLGDSASPAPITRPWTPRADGKQAILVNERATVFDHKLAPPPVAEEGDLAADPVWNDQGGTVWTPDLVHCRLLYMAETFERLPPALRRRYVSVMGNIAISEREGSERRVPPSPAAISLADWTFERVLELPGMTRRLISARSYGISYDKIVDRMRRNGIDAKRQTVVDWELQTRRWMAGDWRRRHHPVDLTTYERWGELFLKRQK